MSVVIVTKQHCWQLEKTMSRRNLISFFDTILGTGDAVLKLNIGGSPFRLKVSSIFLRGDEGKKTDASNEVCSE